MAHSQDLNERRLLVGDSLARHGTHVGVVAPLGSSSLVGEVATRVIITELQRRLPNLTLRLFEEPSSAERRRWSVTIPAEPLSSETASIVDALVHLEGTAATTFEPGDELGEHEAYGGSVVLPLVPQQGEAATVDLNALVDLAVRCVPEVDGNRVIEGLRARGMWTEGPAVVVDIAGGERPDWWWSVVRAQSAGLGAEVVTASFDAAHVSTMSEGAHVPFMVGPETSLLAVQNAACLVTADPHLERLARSLGTSTARATAATSEELHRNLVDDWSRGSGVDTARMLAVDVALDRVAEVASATASLRSPEGFNEATVRLTKRVSSLEATHKHLMARMISERRTTAGVVAEFCSELDEAEGKIAQLKGERSRLEHVLELTQLELRGLRQAEARVRSDPARMGWRRFRLLRGLRRLVPGRARQIAARVVRRLRRSP